MFYKFLSNKAQAWLNNQLHGESWENIWQQNPEKATRFMQNKLGYVIRPGDMFSDWQEKKLILISLIFLMYQMQLFDLIRELVLMRSLNLKVFLMTWI